MFFGGDLFVLEAARIHRTLPYTESDPPVHQGQACPRKTGCGSLGGSQGVFPITCCLVLLTGAIMWGGGNRGRYSPVHRQRSLLIHPQRRVFWRRSFHNKVSPPPTNLPPHPPSPERRRRVERASVRRVLLAPSLEAFNFQTRVEFSDFFSHPLVAREAFSLFHLFSRLGSVFEFCRVLAQREGEL